MSADKIINLDNISIDNSNPVEEKVIQNADISSVDYEPHSQICSTVETTAPFQLMYEMNKAIGKVDRYVKGVDKFVMEKLGYQSLIQLCHAFSAEQVDAIAVAIYQIEKKGQSLIVGDMTGVGKGRIAGALMRYAKLQGKVPIFFTEKPNLFSDIYRDIIAIGSDNGIVQDYNVGEREVTKNATLKEIKERILEDIENGNYELEYDADKLFKAGYEKQTADALEEYREQYFPSQTRMVTAYKKNADYAHDFKKSKHKFVPFIINNRGDATHVRDTNGNIIYKGIDAQTKKEAFEAKELPKGFDCVLLTYSQIRNPNKGKDKAEFIEELAKGNIIIMDESHNASGTSNTGKYLQRVLAGTAGACFLSATFAKRPDNMPIYAQKTAIADAGLTNDELINAITAGGVALQEVLSAELVSEGQMVRREKSYEGIDVNYVYLDETLEDPSSQFYNPKFNLKPQHLAISDRVTEIIRRTISFQAKYVNEIIEKMDEAFAQQQESVEQHSQLQEAGINNNPLFSGIFNMINQLLLAVNAEAVAEWAIMRLRQGKKPVIALANTMESFLDHLAETTNDNTVPTDFSMVLKRRLMSVLKYTRKYADGTTEVEYLNPDEQSAPFQDEYYKLMEDIEEASIGINISPIDVIINKIEQAGYSISEVTGRNKYIQFVGKNKGIIKNRIKPNNSDIFRKFNENEIDCLLINQSGATGASAHAIKTNKVNVVRYENGVPVIPTSLHPSNEVKQRVMIVLQAELNVNTEVQKRGRINRTGQVFLPIYDYIISAIPASMRYMMMLQKKLKSLDANTTSNQKQSTKIIDTVDFLNEYGDEVIIDYMSANPEMNEITGNILKFENGHPTDETRTVENRAHRVSGRVAILSSEMQEDFYNKMTAEYQSYVQKKKDDGSYNLEVQSMPLNAKRIKVDIKEPPLGEEGHVSAFSEGVYIETMQCDNLRKPYEQKEVLREVNKALQFSENGGITSKAISPQDMLDYHLKKFTKLSAERYESEMSDAKYIKEKELKAITEGRAYDKLETKKEKDDYVKQMKEQIEQNYQDRVKRIATSTQNLKDKIEGDLRFFYAKRRIDYPLHDYAENGARASGICLGIKIDYKQKNPFAPSNMVVRLILANSLRMVTYKCSDSFLAKVKEATNSYSNYTMESGIMAGEALIDNWDDITSESRADKVTKYIATGNILKAMGSADIRSGAKLITFSTSDGKLRKGVLLKDDFKLSENNDVTIPLLKALPIMLNISEREQIYTAGSTSISFSKKGDYWKIIASNKRSENIYKDTAIEEYTVYKWQRMGGDWYVDVEGKENMVALITYLANTYGFKISLPANKFDAWKEKLGYAKAIRDDIERSAGDGVQKILGEYNQEYDEYEKQKEREGIETIDQEEEKPTRTEPSIQLKIVKLYFALEKAYKEKLAQKYALGGTVDNLTGLEKKRLRYYLKKYKDGNATQKDLQDMVDTVQLYSSKLHFTERGRKQIEYYIAQHNQGNLKPHQYLTFGDEMLSEFGGALFEKQQYHPLTIDMVRNEHKNLPKKEGDRFAVIVGTTQSGWEGALLGVQYWTQEMIDAGTAKNTDGSTSHFVELL